MPATDSILSRLRGTLQSDFKISSVNMQNTGANALNITDFTSPTPLKTDLIVGGVTSGVTGDHRASKFWSTTFAVDGTGAIDIDTSAANAITIGGSGLAGTGQINIGTTGIRTGIAIGSTATVSSIDLVLGTAGTLNLAATAHTHTINLGTGAAVVNAINLGGTGANVIAIGNTQTLGSISLGAAMLGGTISIGGTGAQTGTIDIGVGTGAQSINLGTGGTGVKTIAIGGTAANIITIGNTQAAGSITAGDAMTTGTITIGGTAQTGTITLGNSSGTNIVDIGIGTGATTVNLATGITNAKTVNIGTGAAMANGINIGGTGANVVAIGNTQTLGSISLGAAMLGGTISIGGTGANTGSFDLAPGTGAQTISIASSTGGKTINIGNGAGANTLMIGTTNTTSTTTIRAGSGNINLDAARTTITGDLVVQGTTTSVDSETVLIKDNHLYLNSGYETAVGQTGGLVVNYLPTANATTVVATGFVAGVVATSNPTVAVLQTGTTIAAGSAGASLPQATINVASTTGFVAAGTVYVRTAAGLQTVTYTGITGTSFTGASGGTGLMSLGGTVNDSADPIEPDQFIQITGASNIDNDGLFEVSSNLNNILTIKGIGTVARVEDFTQNQFVTSTVVAGTIVNVTVSIMETSAAGAWQMGQGSQTPIAFVPVASGSATAGAELITEFTIGAGGATQTSASPLPATAIPTRALVQISTAFTTATTLQVGNAGTLNKCMSTTDIDITTLGIYEVPLAGVSAWGSSALVAATFDAGPGAGAGRVRVYYAAPPNA